MEEKQMWEKMKEREGESARRMNEEMEVKGQEEGGEQWSHPA